MNRAVIGAGSNMDPENNIAAAKKILAAEQQLLKFSNFIKTKPIGFKNQPDFLNGAFLIETELDQSALKAYLKEVEDRLGRVRTENKFGPRTIDLDIAVWNGEVVDEDYYTRDFLRKAVEELIS